MPDLNLNDGSNINYLPEQKEEAINEFNQRPVVKENSIKAIDEKKRKDVSRWSYRFLIFLALLGVISFISIAGLLGFSFYNNYNRYNELTLFPKSVCSYNLTCEPQICNVPKCPENKCPNCELTCGNYNITSPTPIVNVYTNSS